jgi:hypothetical protein
MIGDGTIHLNRRAATLQNITRAGRQMLKTIGGSEAIH